MKLALVHDWLISPVGGAENTLKEIHALFPGPVHTLVCNHGPFPYEIKTSFIQYIPKSLFRLFLPLFPRAIQQFNFSDYDLILSSSHCVAKGARTHKNQLHICYCHTPMRYAWDLRDEYLRNANLTSGLKGWLTCKILKYIRKWDYNTSNRVDHFIANSHFIAARIKKNYGRDATVIYPPVDTSYYFLETQKANYYITSSRLVAYKKIDLIAEAFAQMPDLKLIIIGDGPEAAKIKRAPNIEFLGYVPNEILRKYLQKAKAFLFAAIEDFGILPIEAMACGTPVIALNKGGTAETILNEQTGLLFEEQTTSDIQKAVRKFETMQFDPTTISKHASRFSKERFRSEYKQFVDAKIKEKRL